MESATAFEVSEKIIIETFSSAISAFAQSRVKFFSRYDEMKIA
jgi:hypothetical protein